jgi:glycogen debranching enzyme
MSAETVSILDGSTFAVSNRAGDMDARPDQPHGFFYKDTRHLSRWVLTVNGVAPAALSTDTVEYYFAQFFLAPPTGTIYRDPSLSLIRRRLIGEGFVEEVTLMNHGAAPAELVLRVDAGADFADLFEVKDVLAKKGTLYREVRGGELVLGYRRGDFVRETQVGSSEPAEVDGQALVFRVQVPAKSEWTTRLAVRPVTGGEVHVPKYHSGPRAARPNLRGGLQEWVEGAPRVSAYPHHLARVYARSLVDLAALRFYPDILPGASVPAAGLPWFMALFGRDSLITSYQALPFAPELAATTLRVLAACQGKVVDDFREEEPGKILHELRFGELTVFGERPHSPYYGSTDATPLFLVLLDEYERWTGDAALARELEGPARAALLWIDRFGDRDGDGYVEYQRKTEAGLDNQCWKDSWNSVVYPDGQLAPPPRATCEIQGYVYDAKVRCARLAREVWDDEALAVRLAREAADLKRRFNRDFWVDDRGFFALALDGQKRRVDTLTSNLGHLLWSGIVDEDRAAPVIRHLTGPRLFSGWGVRTMAEGEGPYNPIEYHNGTVWPHDTALAAAGLARYGDRAGAGRLALALFQAAYFFQCRLPEVFAGYARDRTVYPVEYPTACTPQAWAAGTPLLLFRVMLGLEPSGDRLASDPALPAWVGSLAIQGIPGRWGRADVVAEDPAPPPYRDIFLQWFAERGALSGTAEP